MNDGREMLLINRLVELYKYRELIRNLVVRDLKLRYKNSFFGFAWCLVNPLLMTAVFTFVFGVLMKSPQENFPIFLLTAMLPWNWFSTSLMGSIGSVVGNGGLIKKVYFPREVLPLSVVLSNLVNFLFALVALFGFLLAFQIPLSWLIILLPVVMVIQFVFTLSLSMVLAAINVSFRDTEVIMDVIILAWFFVTPIFYDLQQVFPAYTRMVYIINPMASIISSYRMILYYNSPPDFYFLSRIFVTSLLFLAIGYWFFHRQARAFGETL